MNNGRILERRLSGESGLTSRPTVKLEQIYGFSGWYTLGASQICVDPLDPNNSLLMGPAIVLPPKSLDFKQIAAIQGDELIEFEAVFL